jgi:hypothetical protein
MSALISPPFNLVFDQLILAKVSATNANGVGLLSSANLAGARI